MNDVFDRCVTLTTNANEPVAQAIDLFYALCREICDFTTREQYEDYLTCIKILMIVGAYDGR